MPEDSVNAGEDWKTPTFSAKMAHMLDNIGASEVRFTPTELTELNASVSGIQIRGERLPTQVLVFSGVEAPPRK